MLVILLSPVASAQAQNADWPQWLGPSRDGSAPLAVPDQWPAQLTQQWKLDVGLGYATPLVVGERVYMFSRRGDDEVLAALEAATGEVIWESRYPAPYELVRAAERHGLGPKSTPAYANGRLFTFGISGILSAFDAASGKRLWQRPAPAAGPRFSTAQSPIVDRGLLIVHVGGDDNGALTAFDPATGDVVWEWTDDGPSYGSPMVTAVAGVRQVITFTQQHLVGISAETGELLWQRPFETPSVTNSQTPVLHDDLVIYSGPENPMTAIRIRQEQGQWVTEEVWVNEDLFMRFTNGVVVDGVFFGLSPLGRGTFFFLDANTGRTLWTGEPRAADNASISKSGRVFLALTSSGELIVADATESASLTELSRYTVADTDTWAPPALSGNRIFVKDVTSLTLWTF